MKEYTGDTFGAPQPDFDGVDKLPEPPVDENSPMLERIYPVRHER